MLMRITIDKNLVENVNKRGKFVQRNMATIYSHTLMFVPNYLCCVMTGGHMEWNTTVDKLILEWLVNCTPPTCIRVNILFMALAVNPGFKVVKEIPCVH